MTDKDLFSTFALPAPPPFSYKIKIYVVEEHNEQRLFLVNHLQKAGFNNVRSGRDGLVALNELKADPADVVLADAELPSVTGFDLLKELKEDPEHRRGGFILLAKPGNKDQIMLAVESGIDEILLKPFAPADFLPKVRLAFQNFNNPKNPERLYEMAKIYLRGAQFDKAEEIYKALADSAQNAARPLVGLARCALGRKDTEAALKHLSAAVERNPNFVHAFSVRGELYAGLNENDSAEKDFTHAIELSPLNLARYHSACELLVKLEKFEPCIKILNKAIEKGIDDAYIIERLGYCYFRQKDYTQAQKLLERAVKLDPNSVSYLNSLAICYRDAKDFDNAISTYNMILKKEPENSHVLFNKALVFTYKGDLKEAIRLLERVVKMDSAFEKARDKLAELQGKAAQSPH